MNTPTITPHALEERCQELFTSHPEAVSPGGSMVLMLPRDGGGPLFCMLFQDSGGAFRVCGWAPGGDAAMTGGAAISQAITTGVPLPVCTYCAAGEGCEMCGGLGRIVPGEAA